MTTKKSCTYHDKCDKKDNCEDCTTEQKVENLKKAIRDIGFKIEETTDGEIKISQQN